MIEKIDAIVATGRYRSRGEYIMAALRLMEESQSGDEQSIKEGQPEQSTGRT